MYGLTKSAMFRHMFEKQKHSYSIYRMITQIFTINAFAVLKMDFTVVGKQCVFVCDYN